MKNKILVLMAHADDAEIWAGGTLYNHFQHGEEILFVYLFCHEEVRRREAINAASEYNSKIEFWSWPIGAKEVSECIAVFNPSIIITHWEQDTHHEHVKVFESIFSIIPALVVDYQLKFNVYSCDCYNSLGRNQNVFFNPTDFVDISLVWNKKKELISRYKSQPIEYWLEMIRNQNRLNGLRVGVEYAEGFIQVPVLGVVRKARNFLKGVFDGTDI